jgi:hypothetical protein
MIFEGRAAHSPSTAVVNFRDGLEEATASARNARGTTRAQAAPVATRSTAPNPNLPQNTTTQPLPADPQPQPFEPVNDTPATAEPLPTTTP